MLAIEMFMVKNDLSHTIMYVFIIYLSFYPSS